MNTNNPRKALRKNINSLQNEIKLLEQRKQKFIIEMNRLRNIEKNEQDIMIVKREADNWNSLNWLAFPL